MSGNEWYVFPMPQVKALEKLVAAMKGLNPRMNPIRMGAITALTQELRDNRVHAQVDIDAGTVTFIQL